MPSNEISGPKKFMGFEEWEVRSAANILKEAVELEPKLLTAAKAWIKKDQKAQREAVGLADNL